MEAWVKKLRRADRLATCSITELGFVRIGPQAGLSPSVALSVELLTQLKRSRKPQFKTLNDSLGCDSFPAWVRLPSQTTDGHLCTLAESHGAKLVTFDETIPGAFSIP
jgi:hypothetical protein